MDKVSPTEPQLSILLGVKVKEGLDVRRLLRGGGQEKHCYTSHADWAGHQGEGTCASFPAPPEIAPFLLPSPFAFARSKLRRAGAARSVTTAQRRWEQMARRRPATGRRAARAASRERALETAMGFFV